MNGTLTRPATQKQFDLIKKLIAERELDMELSDWVEEDRRSAVAGTLSSYAASLLIDALLNAPRRESAPAEEPEAGIYVAFGDHYIRVYHGQQSGRMLAKRISWETDGDNTTVSYEYLGLASRVLTPDATPERLSIEEVGSLGITTNHCMICGRRLDDPESVDRGIGPVCAANY